MYDAISRMLVSSYIHGTHEYLSSMYVTCCCQPMWIAKQVKQKHEKLLLIFLFFFYFMVLLDLLGCFPSNYNPILLSLILIKYIMEKYYQQKLNSYTYWLLWWILLMSFKIYVLSLVLRINLHAHIRKNRTELLSSNNPHLAV